MNDISKVLNFDPLLEAGKITGKSYKDDAETEKLGMALFFQHNQLKEAALKATSDSHYNMSLEQFLEIVNSIGFQKILEEDFKGREGQPNKFFCFWDRRGILLTFDTYTWADETKPHGVNGGRFSYNWKPNDTKTCHRSTSSGGFYHPTRTDHDWPLEEGVWCGYHDCREGIRHNIDTLDRNGKFVTPWANHSSFRLYLMHYMDWDAIRDMPHDKGHDEYIEACNQRRLAQFPKEVQAAINYKSMV